VLHVNAPRQTGEQDAILLLKDHLKGLRVNRVTPTTVARGIGSRLLAASPHLTIANIEHVSTGDLWLLFDGYDHTFFAGLLSRALAPAPRERLHLRLSTRMTSAAGKLVHHRLADPARFEIAVSSHLLFSNFASGTSPVSVNGLPCHTRLDALQRIFEHELVHLVEVLTTGRTSCRAAPFRGLARTLFGHIEVTHRLPTPRQKAWQEQLVRPGTAVCFRFQGRRLEGFVNRITKRATVLVPDPKGRRYSDGGRYAKFYIPVEALERR